jgi:hypothetical protein
MRALASSLLALCLALLCGHSPSAPREELKALDTQLRGLTLGEAVRQLGLKPGDCTLFDEPPGVARGIHAKLPDGRTVQMWLARRDGLFRENRDWTFRQIAGRRVAAVDIRR